MAPKNGKTPDQGSSSAATPTLTKKQEHTVITILEQLKGYVHDLTLEQNKIEHYLAKQAADLLKIAMNRPHYAGRTKKEKVNVLDYMTELALFTPLPEIRQN